MKFIAASDFRKTTDAIKVKGDVLHELHVHKGAEISIGGDAALEDMKPADVALCSQLNAAGRIVAFDDEKSIAKIKKEIEAQTKRENAAAEKSAGKK